MTEGAKGSNTKRSSTKGANTEGSDAKNSGAKGSDAKASKASWAVPKRLRASLDASLPVASAATASGLVAGLKSFAAGHGGATAVIEYAGRRGARIVLIGQDNAQVDQFVDSTQTAREACARAGVPVDNAWERELVERMRPSNDLWRSMGRRVFSR